MSGFEIAGLVIAAGLVFALIALVVLSAAAFGAYIVYKTKREDGTAFQLQDGAGEVGVAPGEYDDVELPLGEDTTDRRMESALNGVMEHTKRFMRQEDAKVRG